MVNRILLRSEDGGDDTEASEDREKACRGKTLSLLDLGALILAAQARREGGRYFVLTSFAHVIITVLFGVLLNPAQFPPWS